MAGGEYASMMERFTNEELQKWKRTEEEFQKLKATKELGLDPNAKADSTNLPKLYRAAMEGSWQDASPIFLDNENAKTTKISTLGMTALHVAASCGQSEFVEELVKILSREQLEARDQLGRTALHHVALAADVDAAKAMVKKNPNLPYLGDVYKHTPLFYAAKWRHPSKSKEMVKYLFYVSQNENLTRDLEDRDHCDAFTGDSAADLIVAVTASGSYDIALRILQKYPKLALDRNEKKRSILHVLAMQPDAFRSGNKLSAWISWMYKWVQVDKEEEAKQEVSTTDDAASSNNIRGLQVDKEEEAKHKISTIDDAASSKNIQGDAAAKHEVSTTDDAANSKNIRGVQVDNEEEAKHEVSTTDDAASSKNIRGDAAAKQEVSTTDDAASSKNIRGVQVDKEKEAKHEVSTTDDAASSKNIRGDAAASLFKLMSKFSKGIREIFKTKQRHLRAVRLVKFVCKELQKMEMESVENYFIPKDSTAILHSAVEHGVIELVQECLNHFPDLIWYADTATQPLSLHDAQYAQYAYTATGRLSLHDAQSTDATTKGTLLHNAQSADTATGRFSLHDAQSTDAVTGLLSLHDAQYPYNITGHLSLRDTQNAEAATGHLLLHDAQSAETTTGRLLLHVAIEHRRVKIFNYIIDFIGENTKTYAESQLQGKNNTLHLAAKLAPAPQLQSLPGPAFQMQRELQWFKAVEALVYYELRTEKNSDEKTPQEVFVDAHKDLLFSAKDWIKDTSNSCMVVATLVATVAFAAMITVPGGNNSNTGIPVMATKKLFVAFSISNAFSMISSAISLLMFLSMQTSKCTEEDFLESLPKILLRGLFSLGIAVATMMISFGTAIGLSLQTRLNWAYIPITVVACFPVIIFTQLQLPLLLRTFVFKSGPVISQRQRGRKSWSLSKIGYNLLATDRV